jgi:hypothetical protein
MLYSSTLQVSNPALATYHCINVKEKLPQVYAGCRQPQTLRVKQGLTHKVLKAKNKRVTARKDGNFKLLKPI